MAYVGRTLGQALGKLFRSVRNPKWYAAQAGKAASQVVVVNPVGQRVRAQLSGHYHHDDGKLGDHYVDSQGHEYIVVDGKAYRYDAATDTFYHATDQG